MKKIMIVLLTLLVVMSTATRQASADEPLAGGWTPAADYTVTEELQAEAAVEEPSFGAGGFVQV